MRALLLVVVVWLLIVPAAGAEWVPVPQKRACPRLPEGYVCSRATQITFGYPAVWNGALEDDGGLIARSVMTLEGNGVHATWYLGGNLAWNLVNLPGTPTRLGGLPAKVAVATNGQLFEGCRQRGGDEQIVAWVKRRRANFYAFFACLRGPELVSLEAEVARVLASARFPYGSAINWS
jgi:hypothetical protein